MLQESSPWPRLTNVTCAMIVLLRTLIKVQLPAIPLPLIPAGWP